MDSNTVSSLASLAFYHIIKLFVCLVGLDEWLSVCLEWPVLHLCPMILIFYLLGETLIRGWEISQHGLFTLTVMLFLYMV